MADKFTDDDFSHWHIEPSASDPEVLALAMLDVADMAKSDDEASLAVRHVADGADRADFAEPDAPAGQASDLTALPGTDGVRAEQLLREAMSEGARQLHAVAASAAKRLLRGGGQQALAARRLFDDGERQRLAEALAAVNASANLLGRSRIRGHQRKAQGQREFSEPLRAFADPVPLLPPKAALDYFRRLEPAIGVDPHRFSQTMERQAFTLAEATEETLLDRMQETIARLMEEGAGARVGAKQVGEVLDAAGVTPANPGYAELVYRTNAADSYVQGSWSEFASPDMEDTFSCWIYANPVDSRSRPEHAARNGRYYSSKTPFTQVRGTAAGDVINCRCSFIPVTRWEWEDLQKQGAKLSG